MSRDLRQCNLNFPPERETLKMPKSLDSTIIFKSVLLLSLISACTARKSNRDLPRKGQEEGAEACSNEGMADRRSAVFARTTSCAATATGLKLADTLQAAALAAGELQVFGTAIRSFNSTYANVTKMELNIGKAALCSKIFLGEYVQGKTMVTIADQLRKAGTGDTVDLQAIAELGDNIATSGGLDLSNALNKLVNEPNIENTLKVAILGTGTFADLYQIVKACGPVFTEIGSATALSTAQIGKLTASMAKIGLYAAIADCAAAGLFNAIDVGTEWQCLKKDLNYLKEQNQTILSGQQAQCSKLKLITDTPTSIPLIRSKINETDPETNEPTEDTVTRQSICQRTIYGWGNCLASTYIDDRQTMCEKLCDGRSASVRSIFDSVAEKQYLNPVKTFQLITNFTEYCISSGNPSQLVNDGITPCVNACLQSTNH
jgi:hypothetical protein